MSNVNELDEIFGPDPEEDKAISALIEELMTVSEEASRAESRKKEIKKILLGKLDEVGATRMTVAGRTIYSTTKTYYGVDKDQLAAFKAWIEQVAPEANIPASANVNKAVQAFMDENPGADLPTFITKSESVSLGNRKA